MDALQIEGGHPIAGSVAVRGAKNSISKQLVASLLTDRPVILHNAPAISDTWIVSDLLRAMGVDVQASGADGAGTLSVNAANVTPLGADRLGDGASAPFVAAPAVLRRHANDGGAV